MATRPRWALGGGQEAKTLNMLFFVFFFKLFICRNFIFLNQGKHPTLTPSFYPPGVPLVSSPSFLPSVLGKVLGGSHWARRASPP